MQYVKTSGIGYGFTLNKAEAMQFETASQAQRVRDGLAPQFPGYSWEVVTELESSYLVVSSS